MQWTVWNDNQSRNPGWQLGEYRLQYQTTQARTAMQPLLHARAIGIAVCRVSRIGGTTQRVR
jgi:hypothetical protein